MDILTLHKSDARYPSLLKEIFDPPSVLYYRGALEALEAPCLAVVGTRQPSPYGERIAFSFAQKLAQRGVTIVSGLAYGIDAEAHKGALKGEGRTVAVLAQPLDELQPTAHRWLAESIVEKGGLLLSEYASGKQTYKSDYLVRNRLIAGLSKAVLVVEAGFRSGALNTAKHALEMSREVLCVPGRIGDPASEGCLIRLRRGEAGIVTRLEDVLEALNLPIEKKSDRARALRLKGFCSELVTELSKCPASLASLAEKYPERLSELYSCLSELELLGILRLDAQQHYVVGSV